MEMRGESRLGHGVAPSSPKESGNRKKLLRWSKAETLLLLAAKRRHEESLLIPAANGAEKVAADVNKWKRVCHNLRVHGVDRDHVACKKRWFHLLGDYKKIQDWQSAATTGPGTGAGSNSFWLMQPHDRRNNRLPSGFDKDVYEAFDNWLGDASMAAEGAPPLLESTGGAAGSGEEDLEFDVENDSGLPLRDGNSSFRPCFNTDAKFSASKRQRQSTPKNVHSQGTFLGAHESLIHILEKNGRNMEIALRRNCKAQIDAQKQISQAQVDAQKQIIDLQVQQGREFVGAMYALVGALGELAKSLRTEENGI